MPTILKLIIKCLFPFVEQKSFQRALGITFQTVVVSHNFCFIFKFKTIKRSKGNCGITLKSIHNIIRCYCLVAKLYPSLLNSMHCSPPGSSVHGISQTRILEWVVSSFSRGSSWPRDRIFISCIADGFFTTQLPGKPSTLCNIMERKLTFITLMCEI